MSSTLNLLCAGAAQGLVKSLEAEFLADADATVAGRFGAVGAMKEALLAGEACDVFVSTDKMIGELIAEGRLRADARAPLGRVRTGIAVRRCETPPDVSTPEALKAALLAADAIYFPDAVRSTAGIHFANVMRDLGIFDVLEPRFRTYPNGATAMRELAANMAPKLIGCTQVTEINYTEGVRLVGALPPEFSLKTTYAAGVCIDSSQPELARAFAASLGGAESAELRRQGGFL